MDVSHGDEIYEVTRRLYLRHSEGRGDADLADFINALNDLHDAAELVIEEVALAAKRMLLHDQIRDAKYERIAGLLRASALDSAIQDDASDDRRTQRETALDEEVSEVVAPLNRQIEVLDQLSEQNNVALFDSDGRVKFAHMSMTGHMDTDDVARVIADYSPDNTPPEEEDDDLVRFLCIFATSLLCTLCKTIAKRTESRFFDNLYILLRVVEGEVHRTYLSGRQTRLDHKTNSEGRQVTRYQTRKKGGVWQGGDHFVDWEELCTNTSELRDTLVMIEYAMPLDVEREMIAIIHQEDAETYPRRPPRVFPKGITPSDEQERKLVRQRQRLIWNCSQAGLYLVELREFVREWSFAGYPEMKILWEFIAGRTLELEEE